MMINFGDLPSGKLVTMTDAFDDILAHTMREAARVGIELGFFNCEGWSSSGGPWVTPEDSMQMLVWSETRTGTLDSGDITVTLPQPLTRHEFYRDIAIMAYATPPHERERLGLKHPAGRSRALPGLRFMVCESADWLFAGSRRPAIRSADGRARRTPRPASWTVLPGAAWRCHGTSLCPLPPAPSLWEACPAPPLALLEVRDARLGRTAASPQSGEGPSQRTPP
jgi:hypothetical protein